MNAKDIQIQFVPITECEYNQGQIPGVPENPRLREDARQKNLEKSIEELPEMTVARAAICYKYNGKYVVIGGNRRLEAQIALGRDKVPIIALPQDITMEKLRRIALIDNESTGETDWNKLAKDWDIEEIKAWNIETPKGWFNSKNHDSVKKDLSNNIEFSYLLEITFDNEKEQQLLYEELTKRGLQCRVLTL